MRISIRAAQRSDVELLAGTFPEGDELLHEARVREQEQGLALYLVAFDGDMPVGHVKVRWAGSVHDHVRSLLPGVPEVRRMYVAEGYRGQGVAGLLLEAAEQEAVRSGFAHVGLAVGVDNHVARHLYRRSGYIETHIGPFVSSWTRHTEEGLSHFSHTVTYLTKQLGVAVERFQTA